MDAEPLAKCRKTLIQRQFDLGMIHGGCYVPPSGGMNAVFSANTGSVEQWPFMDLFVYRKRGVPMDNPPKLQIVIVPALPRSFSARRLTYDGEQSLTIPP